MTIKMSDVFDLPLTDPVALKYLGSESNAKDAVLEAINAYDANRERIKELEALLVKEKEFSKAIANSPEYKMGSDKYWS